MSGEVCGDDRFELIAKAKRKLLECTNIESSPEEVEVLDNILFRCWQMGWLDQLRENRWYQIFGTPERAMRTIALIGNRYPCDEGCDPSGEKCKVCPFADAPSCRIKRDYPEESPLLEWLKGAGE